MRIIKTSELQKVPEPWGVSIKIFKNESEKVEIGLFSVDPKKSMSVHTHEDTDELIYVLEGKADFAVGNEETELSEGSAVFIPRQIKHKAFNKGAKPYWCLYIVCPLK